MDRNKKIIRTSIIGVIANVLLAAFKILPHRTRWFCRTLPLLTFQRQQCGRDGSARSLEIAAFPEDTLCQGSWMGAYGWMYVV